MSYYTRYYSAWRYIPMTAVDLCHLYITLTLKMYRTFFVTNFMIFNFHISYFYRKFRDIVKKTIKK